MATALRLDVSGDDDGDIPPPRTPDALPTTSSAGSNGSRARREDWSVHCSDHAASQAAHSPPAGSSLSSEYVRRAGQKKGGGQLRRGQSAGSSASISLFEEVGVWSVFFKRRMQTCAHFRDTRVHVAHPVVVRVASDTFSFPRGAQDTTGLSSLAESLTCGDEWTSVSSRSAVMSVHSGRFSYTTKSFHTSNVKEVFLEEWLNIAKAHVPADPPAVRRLGDSPAESGGEIIVIIDSIVQHQRRSPMLGVSWGDFPLFPVGDPQPLSPLRSRVAARYPVKAPEQDEAHHGISTVLQGAVFATDSKRAQNPLVEALESPSAAGLHRDPEMPDHAAANGRGTAGDDALHEADLSAVLHSGGEGAGLESSVAGEVASERVGDELQGDDVAATSVAAAAAARSLSPQEKPPVSHHLRAVARQDEGVFIREREAEVGDATAPEDGSSESATSDAWSAVLHLAEHIMGAHNSSAGGQLPTQDLLISGGAAALASNGDASDLPADIRRLEPHADGVWVVDDGMALNACRPPVTGVPAGLQQVGSEWWCILEGRATHWQVSPYPGGAWATCTRAITNVCVRMCVCARARAYIEPHKRIY